MQYLKEQIDHLLTYQDSSQSKKSSQMFRKSVRPGKNRSQVVEKKSDLTDDLALNYSQQITLSYDSQPKLPSGSGAVLKEKPENPPKSQPLERLAQQKRKTIITMKPDKSTQQYLLQQQILDLMNPNRVVENDHDSSNDDESDAIK